MYCSLKALLRANYAALWEGDADKLDQSMAHLLLILMSGTVAASLYGSFIPVWVSVAINSILALVAIACQFMLPQHVNRKIPSLAAATFSSKHGTAE